MPVAYELVGFNSGFKSRWAHLRSIIIRFLRIGPRLTETCYPLKRYAEL